MSARIDSPTNPRVAAAARAVREGEALVSSKGPGRSSTPSRRASSPTSSSPPPTSRRSTPRPLDRARAGRRRGRRGLSPASSPASPTSSRRAPSSRSRPSRPRPSTALAGSRLVLLLDGLQDPANVGAILRAAEAFGAGGVVLTPGTASPFAPKAFRASAGSALRVPVVEERPLDRRRRVGPRDRGDAGGRRRPRRREPEHAPTASRPSSSPSARRGTASRRRSSRPSTAG